MYRASNETTANDEDSGRKIRTGDVDIQSVVYEPPRELEQCIIACGPMH